MDLQSSETWLLLVCVAVFTITAAISDYRTRRIPNELSLIAFVLGVGFQAWHGGWAGVGEAAVAFAVGFGLFLVLWLIGGGGGGDVKLMGALSVWLGVSLIWQVALFSTVLVAIYSVFVSVTKNKSSRSEPSVSGGTPPLASRKKEPIRVAFAIPVALATWLVIGLAISGIKVPLAML